MPDASTDEHFLRRALDLARQGFGLASPNPHVGAVIVDAQGNIVGTGTYTYDGVKHAEVRALEHAGEKARGGTLYINLEPHSHRGRTPPCTEALIAAGIRRVVASMADPNPKVSGRGFERLRAAGIAVEVGGLGVEARRIDEAFARYILHGIPLVTLKAAMTLDGKIAPPPVAESSHAPRIPAGGWITGEAARANVHLQRHQSDAILVGIGTILADDPLLTDRSGCKRRRRLLRVVLDSHLRIPLESRIVQSASKSDVLVFCSSGDDQKKRELEGRGVQVEEVAAGTNGHADIHAILQQLGKREITSLMIEGGSAINGMALAAGVVDKVFLYYAAKIMAAESAVPFATGADFRETDPIPQLRRSQLHRFGDDFAVEGYLRDPYEA
jgi:diaminohydroxyphosphoribosylaminopyrimidine deaminase/5-amino-6-(5-phosphoribosylamino)uracil reductase